MQESEIEVTERGGRHTKLDVRCDLIPPMAQLLKAKVFKTGAEKYGIDNWRAIPRWGHLNHALAHVLEYMVTGNEEDLIHAACRLDFCLETH